MNIVYTINGEGMGHATRSSVVIEHLFKQGHSVDIFSAGVRQMHFLRQKFPRVTEVIGFPIVYEENRVRRIRTAVRALNNLTDIRTDMKMIRRALDGRKPDVVVTDFETHGHLIARLFDVPLISIDNIQYLNYTTLKKEAKDFIDYELNAFVVKMMVPRADHYFITTFDTRALKNDKRLRNLDFVPPVLRPKIMATQPTKAEHILVYQTSDSYSELIPLLARTKEHYILYNCSERLTSPNITFKKFDEDEFIADLASAKAVITNGGFTVITEALYFKKPILSVPVSHHFEQKLNGLLLQALDLGMLVEQLTAASLNTFLRTMERFASSKHRIVFDNAILFKKLDVLLSTLPRKSMAR